MYYYKNDIEDGYKIGYIIKKITGKINTLEQDINSFQFDVYDQFDEYTVIILKSINPYITKDDLGTIAEIIPGSSNDPGTGVSAPGGLHI